MSCSDTPASFFAGFGRAAMGLGTLLVIAWTGLWIAAVLGGPDWTMPRALLTSAGGMIGLGWIVAFLAMRTQTAPANRLDDQET